MTQWDAPTLAVLAEAGFDCSALPRLADVGGLRAGASGPALKRWPELDGASVRLGLGDGAAACLGSGWVVLIELAGAAPYSKLVVVVMHAIKRAVDM